ncbi:hypothetical protein [Nostoc parmelioides]|nr:hypothetical protein [Nostoc parmelioides]
MFRSGDQYQTEGAIALLKKSSVNNRVSPKRFIITVVNSQLPP